jgi:hypothetical protein
MARKRQQEEDTDPLMAETADDQGYIETLHEALLAAQEAIGAVGKASHNAHHNYKYTSAEDMFAACRAALHDHGLLVRRVSWSVDPATNMLKSVFEIRYPASKEAETYATEWYIVESKGRPADKALGGALTTSFSYFLRDLLLIPREDEAEMRRMRNDQMDERDDREHESVLGVIGAASLKKWLKEQGIGSDALFAYLKKNGFDGKEISEIPERMKPGIAKWGKALAAEGGHEPEESAE